MWKLEDSEIRSMCREKLEALEHWLRRLIDDVLSNKYGDYFAHEDAQGNRLIKKKMVDSLKARVKKEPSRYVRDVDAILLNDAIDIICNRRLFDDHFKEPLALAFPNDFVARTFMKRLCDPRNYLSHANPISIRQAEQVICYSGDIIDSIKAYYDKQNMSSEYNVPLILRVVDSFGNSFFRDKMANFPGGGKSVSLINDQNFYLRPGDTFTIEVEVDPSFQPNEYEISWVSTKGFSTSVPNGRKAVIQITEKQVSTSFNVQCFVTSNKSWHKLSLGCDDLLIYSVKVLPPI